MVRKNCKSDQSKRSSLLDMQSGHSDKEKENIFSVVLSKLKILKNTLFYISYILGLVTLKNFKKIHNFFYKNIYIDIYRYCKILFVKSKIMVSKSRLQIIDTKTHFVKFFNGFRIIKDEYICRKEKVFFNSFKLFFSILFVYLKKNRKQIIHFMNYVYPAIGLGVLLASINIIHNFEYGLKVSCFGKHIGYVENEYVFIDASKQMNSRINYNDNQTPINDSPVYTLVRVDNKINFDKKDDIVDKLLKVSDKIVCCASGLYINDNFIGAVTDSDELKNLLDGYLDPYKKLYPDDEVSFVNDVNIRQGYYLKDSLCKLEDIREKINQDIEEKVIYTVQKGDVPTTIALKNNVSYDQLKLMNPDIEQGLPLGEEVVVSQSSSLVDVKIDSFENDNKEIPYEIEKIEDSNLPSTYNRIIQQGKNGHVEIKYRVTVVNGVETGREVISEDIISDQVPQIWLIGTKNVALQAYNKNNSSVNATLLFPVPRGRISCGWYGYKGHIGIDIAAPLGTPVVAVANGKVIFSGWKGAYGNCVLLDVGNGVVVRLAHNSKNLVSVGEYVVAGQQIAEVGQTGNAYGNHSHVEVIVNGVPRNPMLYFAK